MDILEESYRRAKANDGTCGINGESFASIELFGLSKYLAILQKGLYVPTHASKAGVYPEAEWNDAPVGPPIHSRSDSTGRVRVGTGTDI
jgi:hypothetical protein